MSRLAKQPLNIPSGVTVTRDGGCIIVKGPKGTLERKFKDIIGIDINENSITLTCSNNDVGSLSLWGTYASHLRNMINGVVEGYEKVLEIEGVGYRWEVKGKNIQMQIGFSHPVIVPIPEGLDVTTDVGTMTIRGTNKELVGEFTAKIRAMKKPEPYKGKGIHYKGEVIRRKQGKRTV
ncbi:50S ribosomal protein L6 [Candidatus Nomurabacteria bacterium RIFCSPLOWO2_01_FULL_36_10b]|uniref:50S ribosomal protein L6 n=1 Tax=Candidatus Nomurabacteria bacterium RIFCSPLOWO2_01_FULL_36_10b TaxID=1801766 RepID=A0A1F6WPB5_9BACT|nr:MAG: 50S ribosomal protein L6 [Candidatus Nomurabacteria bacterium RIFCSPLOWO2_01_FULL_36_10b]